MNMLISNLHTKLGSHLQRSVCTRMCSVRKVGLADRGVNLHS